MQYYLEYDNSNEFTKIIQVSYIELTLEDCIPYTNRRVISTGAAYVRSKIKFLFLFVAINYEVHTDLVYSISAGKRKRPRKIVVAQC